MNLRTENWQLRLIQLLTIPGILTAYYLWLYHEGSLFSACTINEVFDCGQVSGPGARYASIGPVPVAMIGLAGYIFIFLLVWLKDWLAIVESNLPELMTGVTGLAFLFTLWLTALEFFKIGAFCQYCLYSAAIITAMFGLAIGYLRSSNRVV
ncbi:MAG: vitamin K epoxide reductase family protein [Chloroflexi bacterium]|nr:vitamin K epoxide reductase family protein [Chloroflexota bacterium]